MIINMAAIIEGLGAHVEDVFLSDQGLLAPISHVEFLIPEQEHAQTVLYLCSPDQEVSAPEHGTINIASVGAKPVLLNGLDSINLVVLNDSTEAEALFAIQGVFQKYSEWERLIQEKIMLCNCSVNEILKASLSYIKSNVLVHDRELRIISYVSHAKDSSEDPLLFSHANSMMDESSYSIFIASTTENGGGDPFSSHEPYFWKSARTGYDCLNLNVFDGKDVLFRIVFTACSKDKEPTEADIPCINALAGFIMLALHSTYPVCTSTSKRRTSQILIRLLEGGQVSKRELVSVSRNQGWNPFVNVKTSAS